MPPLFRQHLHPDDLDTDEENDDSIDPELRLRTVRTAASTINQAEAEELRVRRRKKRSLKIFRSKSKDKRKATSESSQPDEQTPVVQITGRRRNVYLNAVLDPSEADAHGEPLARYVRNKVRTSSECYSGWAALRTDWRRIHNHHIYSEKPLRAVQTVSLVHRMYCKQLTVNYHSYRVANLYFLALVVLQGMFHAIYLLRSLTRL